ncbi:hypothetical protein K469DRAFT_748752 [Zopfia rhizophila CBS 207.26]|uniref:Cytochrome b561 domain-containing protein n=1 Tax=Zopfia rhizophila CBS 207.26 TaxID=1314779 RepID=A0A6A6E9V0_9PEZI|nr:hypothetical protein K469DRAFT_748752 [Zopfia rhizophila CBS 207.26]
MFSSAKVWYTLPVALFAVSVLLFGFISPWQCEWAGQRLPAPGGQLEQFLSSNTLDALNKDVRLHHTIFSLTQTVADTSAKLGEEYDSEGLRSFARNLTQRLSLLRDAQPQRRRRGLIDSLGNAITGGGANSQGGNGGQGLLSSLTGGGGNGTGGLGGVLQEGLSSLGNSIVGGLDTPALFLGIGLGMGTSNGLNLTDVKRAQEIATRVAAAYNAQPTGINLVAQNLGSGLSGQLTPSLSNLGGGTQIGVAAFALAQGIGQGTASGLNLTQQQFQPSNDSGLPAIAGNIGLGISQPIASGIDVQKLFSQAGAGGGQLMAQLPAIAAAAGQGLGQGASDGLGLTKQDPNSLAPARRQNAQQPNVPQTVGEFTRGLSQSFLKSANLTMALNMAAPGASNGLEVMDIMSMLVPIASGAGKGIGEGAAIGLGFQQDTGMGIMPANPSSNQSTEIIVEQFSKGLVASFLANGTATKALENLTSSTGGATSNADVAKVAEGLARGLVEGGVGAISMVGGIENLLSGNFSADMATNLPAMESTNFNDSVGGAAVAFGRGLAGEGTLLISKLITDATKPAPQKRGIGVRDVDVKREVGVAPYSPLTRRAESTPLAINSSMLSSISQAGADAITCQGFGGIAAIYLGLKNSGTIKIDGKGSVPLIVLTTFAFFYALPAYLALGAIQRLSVLIGHPFNLANNLKWRKRIFLGLFLPTSVAGIIFGIIGMGKAQHFQTGHGIFGLITLIVIPPTIVTSVQRLNTTVPLPATAFILKFKKLKHHLKQPEKVHIISAIVINILVQLSLLCWTLGFNDLRSISLCLVDAILTAPVVIGAVMAILFLQVGSVSIVGLRHWFEMRVARNESKSSSSAANMEKGGGLMRSDTVKTLGFNEREVTPPPRATKDLEGREDSMIGWPSNVKKFGEEITDSPPRATPQTEPDDPFTDAHISNPEQRDSYGARMPRNSLAAGGMYERDITNEYAPYRPSRVPRPSSEIDPGPQDLSYNMENRVYAQPQPQPRPSEDGTQVGVTRYASFSRPRPSGEVIRIGYPSLVQREQIRGSQYGYGGYER